MATELIVGILIGIIPGFVGGSVWAYYLMKSVIKGFVTAVEADHDAE